MNRIKAFISYCPLCKDSRSFFYTCPVCGFAVYKLASFHFALCIAIFLILIGV